MKNIHSKVFMSIVLSIVIAIGIASESRAADNLAILASVKGDVQTKSGADGDWKKATTGQPIEEGGQVKTGKSGEAVVRWQQGHMVKVYPLSVITFDKLAMERRGNKETTKLDVESGKILSRAEKLVSDASSFEIKTPTAVAGVRGTAFMVEVLEDASSRISLLEGTLNISTDNLEFLLEENMQVDMQPDMVEEPAMEDLSPDMAAEIEAGLEEMDSIPETVIQSSAPSTSKPDDPSISARDLIYEEDIVSDSILDTIDEVLIYPDENVEVINDQDTMIPPMPPEE